MMMVCAEMGRPKYVVEESDGVQGHRVRLELPNGEVALRLLWASRELRPRSRSLVACTQTYVSDFHAVKKQAEYAVAEVALRRSDCFKFRSVSKEAQQQFPLIRFDGECLEGVIIKQPSAQCAVGRVCVCMCVCVCVCCKPSACTT
jgi:hypothetical protein